MNDFAVRVLSCCEFAFGFDGFKRFRLHFSTQTTFSIHCTWVLYGRTSKRANAVLSISALQRTLDTNWAAGAHAVRSITLRAPMSLLFSSKLHLIQSNWILIMFKTHKLAPNGSILPRMPLLKQWFRSQSIVIIPLLLTRWCYLLA